MFEIFVSLNRIEKFLLLNNLPLDPLEYDRSSGNLKHIHGNIKVYPQVLLREPLQKQKVASPVRQHMSGNQDAGLPVYEDAKHPILPKETNMHQFQTSSAI